MYNIGQYIVHPGQGVCRVEGVVEEPTAVYQLMPVGQRNPMRIIFPVASEGKLRPVLSHDEAMELIDQYATLQVDEYTDRSSALEEDYGFRPSIGIREGLRAFARWYKDYYAK
jgi:CarD family transcriptional regulator